MPARQDTQLAPVRTTECIPLRRTEIRSTKRRILFPLLALVLALVAACGVVELGLRICGYGRNYTNPMGSFFEPDSDLGYHGKANFVGRFRRADFDVVVEHDANGFRRSESPVDQAAPHDVYVLGDSFVWGYGVGQHELLTNQMQRRLSGRRVHNLGLIGAGTVQEYLLFQKHVSDRLRPGDTVVLVFFGNDFGDNVGLHLSGRVYATIDNGQIRLVPPEPASALRQWKNWMKDRSYLFNLLTLLHGPLPGQAFHEGPRPTGHAALASARADPGRHRGQQPGGPHHAALPVRVQQSLSRQAGPVPGGLRAGPSRVGRG